VELSAFTSDDQVVLAYIRHSEGRMLLHLASTTQACEISSKDVDISVRLDSSEPIDFDSGAYDTFTRSRDLFRDGRVVLVPLPEENGKTIGVFVNLLSGKRYFFAPDVASPESQAKIRSLARSWDIIVVTPGDRRSRERVVLFPEFAQ
jgi:hypothetical protein